MAEITDLDVTDANNTTRFFDDQASSSYNNNAQALEGLLARGFVDALEGNLTTAGSASAYTLASPNRTIGAYYAGLRFVAIANHESTGASTLNVSALGAKNILKPTGGGLAALVEGDIRTNQVIDVMYDGTQFVLLSPVGQDDITLDTEKATTSGTDIDFTSIPAGVKRITVMLDGVSTDGTDSILLQLGDTDGIEATGYVGGVTRILVATAQSNAAITTALALTNGSIAAALYHGAAELVLEDSTNNVWAMTSSIHRSETSGAMHIASATKPLSAVLDRLRITTTAGTDNFDAGAINISYQ